MFCWGILNPAILIKSLSFSVPRFPRQWNMDDTFARLWWGLKILSVKLSTYVWNLRKTLADTEAVIFNDCLAQGLLQVLQEDNTLCETFHFKCPVCWPCSWSWTLLESYLTTCGPSCTSGAQHWCSARVSNWLMYQNTWTHELIWANSGYETPLNPHMFNSVMWNRTIILIKYWTMLHI